MQVPGAVGSEEDWQRREVQGRYGEGVQGVLGASRVGWRRTRRVVDRQGARPRARRTTAR